MKGAAFCLITKTFWRNEMSLIFSSNILTRTTQAVLEMGLMKFEWLPEICKKKLVWFMKRNWSVWCYTKLYLKCYFMNSFLKSTLNELCEMCSFITISCREDLISWNARFVTQFMCKCNLFVFKKKQLHSSYNFSNITFPRSKLETTWRIDQSYLCGSCWNNRNENIQFSGLLFTTT